jgi:TfoX/Sxy family transcriptional regulator of competence genes
MASRKTPTPVEAEMVDSRFRHLVAAFSSDRRVKSGKMMASFGLRVDGKIFAMLVRGALVTKLPRERVHELVASGQGRQFDPGHGRLMKEWLVLESPDVPWLDLAREAYQFVGGGARSGRAARSRSP